MRTTLTRYLAVLLIGLLATTAAAAQPQLTVEIIGIDGDLETNVRLYLSIEQQKNSELLTPAQIRRLHRKADREIASALEPFGYYRAEIESTLTDEGDDRWRATYRIDAGPPLIIESFAFEIEGDARTDPEFETFIRSSQPAVGAIFSHVDYENFKSGLSRLAAERGYFMAAFERRRVEIDREAVIARVDLAFDSGPRYRFGELRLDQVVIDDALLPRFASFKPGDPYDLDLLIDFQQALNNTRYFQTVEVSPAPATADNLDVPIDVRLTPRSRHHYKIGFGYGTDTGARARFGWEMPRINTRGHHFDSEIKVSEIGHEILANYRVPVLDPRTDQLVYSAGEKREEFETGPSTRRSVGISLNHGRGNWRETLSLEYQSEDYRIDDEARTSSLLLPGVSWTRTWGRDFINVLDGLKFDLAVRGANENLASDTDLMQYATQLKFITSLGPYDRIIMRGAAGTIETSDFDKVPSSLRFYAGGANSVRGYAYQSLGPTNDEGEAVGARHLLVGSIEFEHYFNDRWGLAVFLDAGNALDSFSDPLEQGAGFGMRWKSPVGPVRVDLANAISDDESWRLHINIGPDL